MFTYMKQLTTGIRLELPSKNMTAEIHLTTQRVRIWSRPVAEQLVLERCGSATDVHVWDGFDEERPLGDAEALHLAPSLVLLAQQQSQLAVAVQVDVGASGVRGGFDADRETGGGRGDDVGSEVNDDGPGGVKPLQRALRAAQIHLLHVPGMAFVHQTAERKEQERHEQNAQQTHIIQRSINCGQRPLADHEEIRPHSSSSIDGRPCARPAACAVTSQSNRSHPSSNAHTSLQDHTALPGLWPNEPLAFCLWEDLGSRNG